MAEPNTNQAEPNTNTSAGAQNTGADPQQSTGTSIDYDKIQQMLTGTLAAKEDTALKAYFKQQGLSQQEVEQAISSFKEQKAKNTPDITAIQTQLSQAQTLAQKAEVENAAILQAVSLGIDAKTIPYVLKMADFSQVRGQDGAVNEEALKNALNKVLEDVPALKPQNHQSGGFQFGASGGQNQSGSNRNDQLAAIFGNKK